MNEARRPAPEYAGFWVRFGATLIDLVFMTVFFITPLLFIYGPEYLDPDRNMYGTWDIIFRYILPFFATLWFWSRFLGTPGKMLLRLKIVDARSGGKMSTPQAVLRYIAYVPAMLPFFLGLFWVGIDEKKQGWHDKIANTVVIQEHGSDPNYGQFSA